MLGSEPLPPRRLHGALAAAGAVTAVLVSYVLLGPSDSGEPTPPTTAPESRVPPSTHATGSRPAPDLIGMRIGEIDWFLSDAGFLPQADASWIAADLPAGRVIEQTPPPGASASRSTLFIVVVSAGGPAIATDDLPDHVRRWVTTVDGFVSGEPILVVPTDVGPAYKTDALLFGECDAVDLVAGTFADDWYRTECLERVRTRVDGVLPDRIPYAISGLPPSDRLDGAWEPLGVGGVVMFEAEPDPARALGISHWSRAAPSTDDWAEPSVEWVGDELVSRIGPWTVRVDVYDDIVDILAAQDKDTIARSVVPRVVGGHLVLDLDPPLRFQKPREVPTEIEVDYGAFRVAAGCPGDERPSVVCDETGALYLEAMSNVPLEDVLVALGGDLVDGLVSFTDREGSWQVEYPAEWHRAAEPLTPNLVSPREMLSIGSYRLRPGGRCAHMPDNALRDLGARDVFVSLQLAPGGGETPWPAAFGPDVMPQGDGQLDANECAERPDLDVRWEVFSEAQRRFYVLVALGDDVDPATEAALWSVLDSFEMLTH